MEYKKGGFPNPLMAGLSARIIATMGMPVLLYRWYFGAYGVRSFERSMLGSAGTSLSVRVRLPISRGALTGSTRCEITADGHGDFYLQRNAIEIAFELDQGVSVRAKHNAGVNAAWLARLALVLGRQKCP